MLNAQVHLGKRAFLPEMLSAHLCKTVEANNSTKQSRETILIEFALHVKRDSTYALVDGWITRCLMIFR